MKNGQPDRFVLVHSSDLHLGDEETTALSGGNPTFPLERVLDAARAVAADAVLLAGDVFESNRMPGALVTRVAALLAGAGRPVIVLAGNHDPLVPDGVWRAGELTDGTGARVLGVTCGRRALLPGGALAVWGNPHRDYDDMVPLRRPLRRRARFEVAVAHGHYDPRPDRRVFPRPAWLIGDAEIAATGADYVALGHWNRATAVGTGSVRAFYSGAPDTARSVNVVSFGDGAPRVRRFALSSDS